MNTMGDMQPRRSRDETPSLDSPNYREIDQNAELADALNRLRAAGKEVTERIAVNEASPSMRIPLSPGTGGLPPGTTSIIIEESPAMSGHTHLYLRDAGDTLLAVLAVAYHGSDRNRIYVTDICQVDLAELPKYYEELDRDVPVDLEVLRNIFLEAAVDTTS